MIAHLIFDNFNFFSYLNYTIWSHVNALEDTRILLAIFFSSELKYLKNFPKQLVVHLVLVLNLFWDIEFLSFPLSLTSGFSRILSRYDFWQANDIIFLGLIFTIIYDQMGMYFFRKTKCFSFQNIHIFLF